MSEDTPFYVASRDLAAAAPLVWSIISDFGGLKRWSEAIEACSADGNAVGAMRTVRVVGGEIHERLEAFDPATYYLRYRPVSGSVMPIDDLNVAMRLTALGPATTRIEWMVYGTPTIDPAKARASIAKRYEFRLGELEACLAGQVPS